MSARGFGSLGWVAGIAATALGCYMVNLKVAAERAELEAVETRIVIAQRDIRLLQTEIGTRGRLAQLEKWNVKVLALSAPQANQFLEGGFQLATLVAPHETLDPAAPVVLASAPAPERRAPVTNSDGPDTGPAPVGTTPSDLMHVASLKMRERPADTAQSTIAPKKTVDKPSAKPAGTATVVPVAGKRNLESTKPKPPVAVAAKTASKPIKPSLAKPLKTAAASPSPSQKSKPREATTER